MNLKTESEERPEQHEVPEFSRGFLWKLGLVTIIALELILLVGTLKLEISGSSFMFPWKFGSTVAISNAFTETRGAPAWVPSPAEQSFVLAGIIVTFVICPSVYLFGWRRRQSGSTPSPVTRPLSLESVIRGFCGVVTWIIVISIGPLTLTQELSTASRCDAEASRVQRDGMINEMKLIGTDAFTYRVRPKDLGGGTGSYVGYVIPERLARAENGEYTATVSADSISIKGESATCATNTITATVNRSGQAYGWRYEGNWLGFG